MASVEKPLVLHVRCVTSFGGGPEKTILNSSRFLTDFGFETVCAYMHPPEDPGFQEIVRRAIEADTELLALPDRGALDWRVLTKLIRYCRTNKVNIWHGHDYKSNALGIIARRFWPMKLVTTVHGWGVQKTRRTPLYNSIDRRCLPYYHEVICVSNDLMQQAVDCGVKSSRCHWIQNAIDVNQFRSAVDRSDLPRANDGPIRLGAMGRLSSEKGFDLLIQAVAELNREGIDCTLQIAGEGVQRENLELQIAKSGFESRFELLGHTTAVKPFFESLDAFVLSSRSEGLPNVVLESMAMNVPVVATRVAGVPQLIKSEENGILVEPESVAELKRGIRVMVGNESMRRKLAFAGRRTIETSFSFEKRMEKVAAIYARVLGRTMPERHSETQ